MGIYPYNNLSIRGLKGYHMVFIMSLMLGKKHAHRQLRVFFPPLPQKSIGERITIDPQSSGESSTCRTIFDNPWEFGTRST